MKTTTKLKGFISFVKWKDSQPTEKINNKVIMVFSNENTPNEKNGVLECTVTASLTYIDLMSYEINRVLLAIEVLEKGKTEYDNLLYEVTNITPMQEPQDTDTDISKKKVERVGLSVSNGFVNDMKDLTTILGYSSVSQLVETELKPLVMKNKNLLEAYRENLKMLQSQTKTL